jgi:hypothetical protein
LDDKITPVPFIQYSHFVDTAVSISRQYSCEALIIGLVWIRDALTNCIPSTKLSISDNPDRSSPKGRFRQCVVHQFEMLVGMISIGHFMA